MILALTSSSQFHSELNYNTYMLSITSSLSIEQSTSSKENTLKSNLEFYFIENRINVFNEWIQVSWRKEISWWEKARISQ